MIVNLILQSLMEYSGVAQTRIQNSALFDACAELLSFFGTPQWVVT